MALTDNEVKIVTLIDQRFWETGGLISDDRISEELGIPKQTISKAWKKEDFRQALLARGVDLTPDSSKGLLTPTQAILANLLFNVGDKRSVREKCEAVGISSQQYTAWLRQPAFSDYLRKRAESVFASTDYQAYQSLSQLVAEKDIQGIKLFFEMRGIYNPKLQVEVNVEQVVVKVVEIVTRHIDDPNVLMAIASEIEQLELGPTQTGMSPDAAPVGAFLSEGVRI